MYNTRLVVEVELRQVRFKNSEVEGLGFWVSKVSEGGGASPCRIAMCPLYLVKRCTLAGNMIWELMACGYESRFSDKVANPAGMLHMTGQYC